MRCVDDYGNREMQVIASYCLIIDDVITYVHKARSEHIRVRQPEYVNVTNFIMPIVLLSCVYGIDNHDRVVSFL